MPPQRPPATARELPSALEDEDGILAALAGRRPALYLDYDGTLAPIALRPELAVMGPEVREALERAAACLPVTVVSGRRREDVERLVGLPALTYAGSHGFDLRGPAGSREIHPELRGAVDRAAAELAASLAGIEGVFVETKPWAAAIHYRLAAPAVVPAVRRQVEAVRRRHGLRLTAGKRIFELRPDVDWDKGRAVRWLHEALGLRDRAPIYVGDDATDEDAFRAIADDGIGVVVLEEPRPTAARWRLRDPGEVGRFLGRLCDRFAAVPGGRGP